jgi:predicted transcriptional regulator
LDFRVFYDWLILPVLNSADKKGKSKTELSKIRNRWGGLKAKEQEIIYDYLVKRGLVRVEKIRRAQRFFITFKGKEYARKFPPLPATLGPKFIRKLLELYTKEKGSIGEPIIKPQVIETSAPKPSSLSYEEFTSLFKECFEKRDILERRKGIVPIKLLKQDLQGKVDDLVFKEYLERMFRQRIIELIPAYATDLTQQQLQESLYIESLGKRYYSVQWRD